jgi:hypothetical protein
MPSKSWIGAWAGSSTRSTNWDWPGKTLVIFSSDNGPWWQGNPGYARGRKLLWFEGGFRVPFLARWPGVIPLAATSPEMSMNFDLFVTCLKLAGVPLPGDRIIDGKDILPLLKGQAPSPHEALFYYDTRILVASGTSAGSTIVAPSPITPRFGPFGKGRSCSISTSIRMSPTA